MSRVTVRRVSTFPKAISTPLDIVCNNSHYDIERVWRVYEDGNATQYFVADCKWGRTMIDHMGEMITCWHVGIGPGDLVRRYIPMMIGAR